jgi:hypothetical protein
MGIYRPWPVRRCGLPAVLFLLLTAWCNGAAGPSDTLPLPVLAPQFRHSKSFAQVYLLTALCDDTTFIQMRFVLTNLGLTDRNAGCNLLILHKSRPSCSWNRKYSHNEWSYTEAPTQKLTMGANRLQVQDSQTAVTAGDGQTRASVTFDRGPCPVVPHNVSCGSPARFFDYTLLLGWTRMQAVVETPGRPPRILHGYGLLERQISTALPTDICRGWLTFRGYVGANACFHANLRLPRSDRAAARGCVWKSAAGGPCAVDGLPIEPAAMRADPHHMSAHPIAPADRSFIIEPRTLLFRYALIDELGPVWGAIVKLVIGSPVTYYYEAQARLAADAPAVPGVLEFMRIE